MTGDLHDSGPGKDWRKVAMSYECRRCWARPGEKCIGPNGRDRYELHADRTRAASNNGWRIADEGSGPGTTGDGPQGAYQQRSAIPIRLD